MIYALTCCMCINSKQIKTIISIIWLNFGRKYAKERINTKHSKRQVETKMKLSNSKKDTILQTFKKKNLKIINKVIKAWQVKP